MSRKNGKAPGRKGGTGEREAVSIAKDHGVQAERARGSDGRSLGKAKTVDAIIGSLDVQVKRRKRIAEYVLPPEGTDMTLMRADRGEWLAVLPYTMLLELLGGKDAG